MDDESLFRVYLGEGRMKSTDLIRQIREDLARIEDHLLTHDHLRALDAIDSLRAAVQGLHLDVWHRYHVSGKGPNNGT